MTWTAPGAWLFANSTALAVSNQAAGNLLLVGVTNTSNNTVWCTGLSGGGATWTPLGVKFAASAAFPEYFTLFAGTVTATGAGTVTPSWSGTAPAGYHLDGHEFSTSLGSWALDVQGTVDSAAGITNWASLTPAASGELYFGFEDNAVSATAGTTSGYVWSTNTSGGGRAYNLSCPAGVATFPVWADSDARAGIMVLVREVQAAAAALAPLSTPLPPGWFPGSAAVTAAPGGIPFAPLPGTTDATPGVIIPPAPDAAPFQAPQLPPGWFPGADKATAQPGGIPFYAEPQPVTAPPAVVFGVPEALGEVQWLPWPPGYFPGSQAVSVDPGGIPFYAQPQPLLPPPAAPGPPVITGLAGTPGPGWFTDQYGNPRLWVCAQPWGLVSNAGAWTASGGGTWQQDIANFITTRAAQGVTAILVYPIQNSDNGSTHNDGSTWDNVPPFNTGQDPASGLNPAYWARVDYMLNAALNAGMVSLINIDLPYNTAAGRCFSTWGTTQYQQWGAALGARYRNQPALEWNFGDDAFPTTFDTFYDAFLTGLSGAGDTHRVSCMWSAEYTSRYATDTSTQAAWGTAHSAYNFTYSYNCEYFCVEYAYSEVASHGASALLPVVWGNGWYYAGATAYSSTNDRATRQETWWVLAAGARGFVAESNQRLWPSSAPGTAATQWFFVNNLKNIITAYTSWPQWWNLLPDLSSALVTAGRGTRATGFTSGGSGGVYEPAFTNSWVTASKTPDGTLAVAYLPNHTTITVNTALLASGWAATWIDPVTGGSSSAGAGPTFNSTAKGANSQGDPDWVLVFQAPAVTTFTGTASAAGAGAVTAAVTQAAPAAGAGASSVTAQAAQIPGASAAGTSSVADVATQIAPATAAGAGAVTASGSVSGSSTAAIAGAGAVTAVVTQIAPATAAGAGSVTAVTTQIAGAAAAGAGAAGPAPATQAAIAQAASAGAVSDAATQQVTAAAAGAGSVTAAGSVTGAGSTASAAGAGSVTAVTTQIVTGAAAGAGSVSDVATQIAKAAPAGAGAATAAGAITGTANVAGAAAAAAKAAQAVPGQAAGAGTLSALSALAATAAITGAGQAAAAGQVIAPVTYGTARQAALAIPAAAAGDAAATAARARDGQAALARAQAGGWP